MSYILLIEDNPANADLVNRVLTTGGYEVRHFLRGLEGARAARSERPDLILLDFNLPDIDGRNLILTLKRQLGGTIAPPIVAVTARVNQLEQKLALSFGCDAFVGKPFQPESLLETVNKLVKSASLS